MPGAGRGASVTFRRCAHGKFSRGRERLVAEFSEGVVAAFEQFAREREACAVAAEPLGGLLVVGVVGARLSPRGLRGLIQRPAQRGRSLSGEVPGRAAFVRGMDGDVHSAVADRLARGGEPAAVAELGEDHDARQRADPVMRGLQRPTAGLAACVGAQLLIERRDRASSASIIPSATVICSRPAAGSGSCCHPRAVLAGEQAGALGSPW